MRTFVVYSFYFYICLFFIFYIAYGALSLGLIGYARAKFDGHYDTALRPFCKELRETRGLCPALQAEGYRENAKLLTRSQVRVIVKYLGEP